MKIAIAAITLFNMIFTSSLHFANNLFHPNTVSGTKVNNAPTNVEVRI